MSGLTRSVDGKVVPISPAEEAKIRAEWAKADAEATVLAKKKLVKEKRILALEKVLERLLEQNVDIEEVSDYLAEKDTVV
jgi:hypothetical protein